MRKGSKVRDFRDGHLMPITALDTMRWWYVYRYFDEASELLYVGVTADPYTRWLQHKRRSPWAEAVYAVSLERFAYEDLALLFEREAIREEAPKHNIRSTLEGNRQQHSAGIASAHARRNATSMPDAYARTDERDERTLEALPLERAHDTFVTRAPREETA